MTLSMLIMTMSDDEYGHQINVWTDPFPLLFGILP